MLDGSVRSKDEDYKERTIPPPLLMSIHQNLYHKHKENLKSLLIHKKHLPFYCSHSIKRGTNPDQ